VVESASLLTKCLARDRRFESCPLRSVFLIMFNINIKEAKINDIQAIQNLNHSVMAENINYDPCIDPDFDLKDSGKNMFLNALRNSKGIFLLAYVDNNLVGYINGSPKDIVNRNIKTFEIENLGVLKEYREKDIALKLYNELMAKISLLGYKRINLDCYYKNTAALKFYNKLGFTPFGISLEKNIHV
jgi:diamine N-acetyltransferase